MKHRTQRRRTCRIGKRPARDVWKHELYEAKGRQRKTKCEILEQKTTEARKHIYHLGKLKKGHRKVQTSRTGTPRRAAPSHEASAASLFHVFDSFAQTMGLPES